MNVQPKNLVIIMADEHNRDVMGAYGHTLVQTPNLDRLAARGTRFTDAYCNSPICVPSRAAFATGQYVHQTGHWDNASPYHGTPRAWHHEVSESGKHCALIGKLHFRRAGENGFTEEILPLHVVDGVGDLKGLLRAPLPEKRGSEAMARDAGPGMSDYGRYDMAIAEAAEQWLAARTGDDTPFVLFVSFVMPHFPLVAPDDCYDLYSDLSLENLRGPIAAPLPDHPVLNALRGYMNYEDFFDDDRRIRALRAYFGMVSAIDRFVGRIVQAIEAADLGDTTRIAYTSDHGDNLGQRGLWGKSVMYEQSVAVPMILAGPDVPQGHVCRTPVSLIDMHPTVMQAVGLAPVAGLPGRSLIEIANRPDDLKRAVFSEYHAAGAITGMFMLRKGALKLIEYPGHPPQLFDLSTDPGEAHDLASRPDCQTTLNDMQVAMATICDVAVVNAHAFRDQAARIAQAGGPQAILAGVDIPHTPAPV